MNDRPDIQLLRAYAESADEPAFRELVRRYTDFVYSAALRQSGSPAAAADLAQSVFIDLARKAATVTGPPNSSLAGWLHRATRFAALNHRRDALRRAHHERQAMEQLLTDSAPESDWDHIRPVLDEALDSLADDDREALLLRYFKNQNFRAVGLALGISDDTAQKRVTRAVDRLRDFFTRRKVTIGAGALVAALSANTLTAAPAGLAATIATAAFTSTAVTTTAATLTATKAIAMTTLQKVAVTAALAALAGAGLYEAHQAAQLRGENQTLQQQLTPLQTQIAQLQSERADLSNHLAAIAGQIQNQTGNSSELLKLRAEVTRLRADNQALANQTGTTTNDPSEVELRTWLAAVKKLKQAAADDPKARIPEFSLLTEQDWLNAAKFYGRRPQLDAETDLHEALAELRQTAQNSFANFAQQALARYARDHDGQFPQDLSQFQPYVPTAVDGRPVDPTILQRYKIEPAADAHMQSPGQDWVLTQKELADPEYDHFIAIGPVSWGYQHSEADDAPGALRPLINILNPLVQKYAAANNGQQPTDPSQLQPYAETDEQKAALQKVRDMRDASMSAHQ